MSKKTKQIYEPSIKTPLDLNNYRPGSRKWFDLETKVRIKSNFQNINKTQSKIPTLITIKSSLVEPSLHI